MQSHKWLHAHKKPLTEPVGSAASAATRHANVEELESSQDQLKLKKSLPGVVASRDVAQKELERSHLTELETSGEVHRDPECHRGKTNEHVIETNTSRRDRGPRGHMGKLERSRGVEGVRDRGTVVNSAKHNGMCPRSDGNTCSIVPNPPCQDRRPGGHLGEQELSRVVEGNWRRQTDVEGIVHNWEQREMDGAMSSARRDSKRVQMDPLTIEKEGQHE